MTKITTERIMEQIWTMKDCMKIPRSSPTSRVSSVVRRSARAAASTSVLPEMRPELASTTCCATSKTAMVMSKV